MKSSDSSRCIRKYQRKDGSFSYHVEIRRKNAKPIRKTYKTLTAAKNWVRSTESSILEGRYVPDNKARKYTLSDLIDKYINIHLRKFPQRLRDQSSHLTWWRENYGSKTLFEITPSLLSDAKEQLLEGMTPRKKKRTNATVNRYFSSLSKAFSLATREWQLIPENPFTRISKLREDNSRNRFLTREELQALLEHCKQSTNPNLYGMVLLCGLMGLRFGECANLCWRNIDLANGFVTLEQTKNSDVRVVPIPQQVAAYLQERKGSQHLDEFLFPSKNPAKRYPYSMIRKAFQKALQELNIKDFKYHDLRHTAASHMAMAGGSQLELMALLGHRSPVMTRRYTHFSGEHLSRLVQKTSNNLIGPVGENHGVH